MPETDDRIQLPAFSRLVVVESLSSGPTKRVIEANEAERAALAHRFGLLRLDRLVATVMLKPINRGALINVSGNLTADVVQSCGVTLEPLANHIHESFDLTYGYEISGTTAEEVVLSLDEEEPPDLIEDGMIDLGEAVAEQLALAIDPFPRKSGVEFVHPHEHPSDEIAELPKSPFGVLARLVSKEK